MQLYPVGAEARDLGGATWILPAVAFANIGELAIDVIITTLKCQLVARLDDDNILACVGNNAYEPEPQGQLATALELYQVPGTRLCLLQQRAPAIPGRQQAFANSIAEWAKQQGISQTILLCGLDAQYRRDRQLEGTQLRYWNSSSSGAAPADQQATLAAVGASSTSTAQQDACQRDATAAACQAVGFMQLEQEVTDTEREVHSLLPPWPLLDALQQQTLQHTLLAIFAAEGDNVQDSMMLASKVLAVLKQLEMLPAADVAGDTSSSSAQAGLQLQTPCSWVGLYGRGLDARSGLF
eukprot:GHUV01010991.1.p1 GENE.GHUV01010991.1~~GHUV01010991.1.p1  ORF type:complete len:296 (+),score=104.94 GHUV01010991.1:234-1121(+)